MDSYLDIAAIVLRAERRPLSPRAILASAYRRALVPSHLHGQTQHKTLQARLSEDIVYRREQSPFFRTEPGRFFLREFLTDRTLPEQFRNPVPTRRRIRELRRSPALAIYRAALGRTIEENKPISPEMIFSLLHRDCYTYEDPRRRHEHLVFIRSFVCVHRGSDILTYRLGRYRDDRDAFMRRRSIGFSTLVHLEDHTLFNLGNFGVLDAGLMATRIDLDIPDVREQLIASIGYFVWSVGASGANDLLAVTKFECPPWFEPVRRRLALSDLAWMDRTKPINDIDDFDPWSRSALLAYYSMSADFNAEAFSTPPVFGQAER